VIRERRREELACRLPVAPRRACDDLVVVANFVIAMLIAVLLAVAIYDVLARG